MRDGVAAAASLRLRRMSPSSWAGALLYSAAWLLGRLPWAALRPPARAIGRIAAWLGIREYRVAAKNVALAGLAPPGRQLAMARAIVAGTALTTLESLKVWTSDPARNLARITAEDGADLFHAAVAAGRGLIVAAPHYGNWELLNQWLAAQGPLAVLYRKPESAIGEAVLRRVRGVGEVTQVPAEGAAMRALYRTLQGGGVVGILPDQQPKLGDGVFAPFFGVQALTMTLLHRLAERTGAAVLVGAVERRADGEGFTLRFTPAPAAVSGPDPQAAAEALNGAIEALARRDLCQYQWTYKRYTVRPPGSGEDNPYWRMPRPSEPTTPGPSR